ncbi:MAG: LPS translocon maturation chaperone LptM [Lysobacteraceae bacterium]
MNLKPLAAALVLTLPLAACGNKGPLVRASAQMPPTESPAPAGTPPEQATPPADDGDATPPADDASTPPSTDGNG